MSSSAVPFPQLALYEADLPTFALDYVRRERKVAWDIETSGLDWKTHRIGTCQLFIPGMGVCIVRIGTTVPVRLRSILEDQSIIKIFHHAMFDLRFMSAHWRVTPASICCTKVAAKVLEPNLADYSLKMLLSRYLQREIDKSQRMTNWLADELTREQLLYAARDVLYLPELFTLLSAQLVRSGRWALAEECFAFLPTRVQLDLLGSGDVFAY